MYTSYFKLTENPFSIAPDPLYLYMSEQHREALAHLQYGIRCAGGFVLLTGEVGAGKTTLCRRLLGQLPEDVDVAFILNPKVSVTELLETICDELHIAHPEQSSIKQLVDRLNARLLEANANSRKTVLIIDEAQNLAPDVLEQLRLLTNLETDRYKLLQIVLLGQPELQRMLGREEMRQLSQRVTARYHLQPLGPHEIEDYVQYRLQVAGSSRPIFKKSLYKTLWKLTNGTPRLMNLICDRALLGAYALEHQEVDQRILRQAAREVLGEQQPVARQRAHLASFASMIILILIIGTALLLWQSRLFTVVQAGSPKIPAQQAPHTALAPAPAAIAVPQPDQEKPIAEELTEGQVPLPVHWPADFAIGQGREEAYADLAQLWDITYPPGQNDFCSYVKSSGLACLARKGSLETISRLDRPAMLTLYDDDGKAFNAVLAQREDKRALFMAGDEQRWLDLAAIEARWFGDFLLLWKPPFAGGPLLQPGGTGPALDWLATALAELNLYQGDGKEERLQGALLSSLKRFQIHSGLTPDGVLGPMTLIHLNTALDISGPHLKARKDG